MSDDSKRPRELSPAAPSAISSTSIPFEAPSAPSTQQPDPKKPKLSTDETLPSNDPSSSSTPTTTAQVSLEELTMAGEAPKEQSNREKKREKYAKGGRGGRGGKQREYKGKDRWAQDNERNAERAAKGEAGEGVEGKDDKPKEARLPKKRTAVLLGFSGTGCKGMQIQKDPSVKTIEGILFEAFVKAGAISKDNSNDSNKVGLARSARTDAGVHAAGNVVSLKMITQIPGVDNITEVINSHLPPQIRMWGYVRVQNSFNARTACDSRTYEYLLPSHMLLPPRPGSVLHNTLKRVALSTRSTSPSKDDADAGSSTTAAAPAADDDAVEIRSHPFWEGVSEETESAEIIKKRKEWRVDSETMERARAAMAQYEGTHNFHNFTVERSFNDRAAQRYMIKMDVRDPVVFNGTEWISFRFHGQSFMLHQIRKMISLALLTVRTSTPPTLIPEAFGPSRIHIPKAPPLGLLLEQPLFGSYNTNVSKGSFTAAQEKIDFEQYRKEMDAFKLREIYERLREEEEATDTFAKWLAGVDNTETTDFDYLNPRGIIPPSAIKVKGDGQWKHRKPETLGEGGEAPAKKGGENGQDLESDDEEVDMKALKNGELEG